jgi:hypothetical protein
MLRKLFKSKVSVFLILTIVIFTLTRIPAIAVTPNLNGNESHPDRLKLSECVVDLKEVVEWDEEEILAGSQELCKLRQGHAKQKARFLNAQNLLTERYKNNGSSGYNKHLPVAISASWEIVKKCLDFKEGFANPHNIAILTIPELFRMQCYSLGADLVESTLKGYPKIE